LFVLLAIFVLPNFITFSVVTTNTYKVFVIADTHFDNSNTSFDWSNILEQRLDNMYGQYDLGLILGDIVSEQNNLDEIIEFDAILNNKNLDENFLIITGNHDTLYGGGEKSVDPYYLNNISPTGTHNFVKRVGNILFIMIGDEGCDSGDGSYGLCSRTTYEWFDRIVSENQDKIIVVSSHEQPAIISNVEALSFSADFVETLKNYNVNVWLYGHTHNFNVQEIVFPTGKRTLFISNGNWECSSRTCLSGARISTLLTFYDNMSVIDVSKVIYDNYSDVTPTIVKVSSYPYLNDIFKRRQTESEVLCLTNDECSLFLGESLCNEGGCVECVQDSDCSPYTCGVVFGLANKCTTCGNDVCEPLKGETVENCNADCTYGCGMQVVANYTLKEDLTCRGDALTVVNRNVIIDCNGHTISGIGFGRGIGSDLNTIIKNCKITNFDSAIVGYRIPANSYSSVFDSEIYNNVNGITTIAFNGPCQFLRNNLHDNHWPLVTDETTNCEIAYNHIHHNEDGVFYFPRQIWSSNLNYWPQDNIYTHDNIIEYNGGEGIDFAVSHSRIQNNIIRYNDVGIKYSVSHVPYLRWVGNIVEEIEGWEELGVKRTNNNIISDNEIYGNTESNFEIFWGEQTNYGTTNYADFANVIENNIVDGKQFYFYFQKHDLTLSGLNADKIYLVQSTNVNISNSTIRDLYLMDTNDSTFTNIAFNGGEHGINSYNSYRNTFTDYTITNTKYSILIEDDLLYKDVNAGLVSHYKFDEGDGDFISDSVGENIATNSSEWKNTSECVSGTCLNFSGDDYVNTNVSDSLNMSGKDFTITAWVKLNSLQDGYKAIYNYNPNDVGSNGWYTLYKSDTHTVHVRTGNRYLNGNTPLQAGRWYFLAGSFENGEFNVYVNGANDGTKIAFPTTWGDSASASAFIGSNYVTSTEGIDAMIDDVRIYERALTDTEIKLLGGKPYIEMQVIYDVNYSTGGSVITCETPKVNTYDPLSEDFVDGTIPSNK